MDNEMFIKRPGLEVGEHTFDEYESMEKPEQSNIFVNGIETAFRGDSLFKLMDNNVTIAHLKNLVTDKAAPITMTLHAPTGYFSAPTGSFAAPTGYFSEIDRQRQLEANKLASGYYNNNNTWEANVKSYP